MTKAFVNLLDGLTLSDSSAKLELTFDTDFLIIVEKSYKGFKTIIDNTFKIPLANFLDTTVTTESDLVEVNKSVLKRGIVGGVLFGPAGLLLGGLSGVGKKQKNQVTHLYVISFVSSSNEIKNITFTMPSMMVAVTKKFDQDLKRKLNTVQRSQAVIDILGEVGFKDSETIL